MGLEGNGKDSRGRWRDNTGGEAEGTWKEVRRLRWSPSGWDLREPVSLATMPAGDNGQNTRTRRGYHRTGDKRSHRDLAGRRGRQSGSRFLQAIRGSQQYQENLGGPGGRNRHVTSHKNSHPGVAWRHSRQQKALGGGGPGRARVAGKESNQKMVTSPRWGPPPAASPA